MKTMRQLMITLVLLVSIKGFGQTPTITGFSPANGPVGTVVTITGTNLSSPTAFTIGGVSAIVVSNTGATLVGMVMPGAVSGSVSVTTSGGTATASDFTVMPTQHPATQQGNKLIGAGGLGNGGTGYVGIQQGFSVAVSADGNTAIVGGIYDNQYNGAAWVYVRSGNSWVQQGPKLVASDLVGSPYFGVSVALSADGNTAAIGGPNDSDYVGATWVFVRSSGVWTQQGSKLVSNDYYSWVDVSQNYSGAQQGTSVALSADGNTLITGGWGDSLNKGAAWIFNRSGSVWTQTSKLVGTGATENDGSLIPGRAWQGWSVGLSADGNTAIVGGPYDSLVTGMSTTGLGAAWIYIRSGSTWTQQGSKLVGSGASWDANEGTSVALSADGNTAIIGGPYDHYDTGAVWIFVRSGSTWSQQGTKLIGTGALNSSNFGIEQGFSVALSADGNLAIAGAPMDNIQGGATWIYGRSGNTWTQNSKLVGTSGIRNGVTNEGQGWSVALSADGVTLFTGSPTDNNDTGAVWVFTPCNTCGPDTLVWPGDADANHLVDNNDLLPIGLAYDSTGPVRAVQGIVWQGDVATDWNDTLPGYSPSVNFKYADCDGNGMVNSADTLAIAANFGLVHAKTNNLPGPWRSGIPGITVQFSQDTVYNNDTLTIDIIAGSSSVPVSDIYGLAFTFNYDPLVVDSNYSMFNFISSPLWSSTNSINFNRNLSTGQVKAAITGIDHSPRSGYGQIATFRCIITTDNINGKNYSYYNNLNYISEITAIDQYGNHIPLNAGLDSNEVGFFLNDIRDISQPTKVNLYPNPAADQVRITSSSGMTSIRIIDIIGNEVLTISSDNKHSETLDISHLAAGVYTVQVLSQTGLGTAKLIISR